MFALIFAERYGRPPMERMLLFRLVIGAETGGVSFLFNRFFFAYSSSSFFLCSYRCNYFYLSYLSISFFFSSSDLTSVICFNFSFASAFWSLFLPYYAGCFASIYFSFSGSCYYLLVTNTLPTFYCYCSALFWAASFLGLPLGLFKFSRLIVFYPGTSFSKKEFIFKGFVTFLGSSSLSSAEVSSSSLSSSSGDDFYRLISLRLLRLKATPCSSGARDRSYLVGSYTLSRLLLLFVLSISVLFNEFPITRHLPFVIFLLCWRSICLWASASFTLSCTPLCLKVRFLRVVLEGDCAAFLMILFRSILSYR